MLRKLSIFKYIVDYKHYEIFDRVYIEYIDIISALLESNRMWLNVNRLMDSFQYSFVEKFLPFYVVINLSKLRQIEVGRFIGYLSEHGEHLLADLDLFSGYMPKI